MRCAYIAGCLSVGVLFCSDAVAEVSRPDLVKKVYSGELKKAHVSWWGFDKTDSTAFLRAALSSPAETIVVDAMPTPWYSLPLKGKSCQTFRIDKGAILSAKRGAFHGINDNLLVFRNATNFVVTGEGEIRMWREDYTNKSIYSWSEWRHAIRLDSCENFLIENVTIAESGGDGVYLGEQGPGKSNRNGVIRNVTMCGNNRQGLSVITADGLLVENCVFRDTCGAPPEAGIDFEPNQPHQLLRGIIVRNCISEGNNGRGFDFAKWLLNETTEPMDIVLENCRSYGNRKSPITVEVDPNFFRDVKGLVTLRNCEFMDDKQTPRALRKPTDGPLPFSISVENCKVKDASHPEGFIIMNESWDRGGMLAACDLEPQAVVRAMPEIVEVRDSCPGRSLTVDAPAFRYRAKFLVYARSPGEVSLKVVQCPLGKYGISRAPCYVEDANGKRIMNLPSPVAEPTEWRFKVEKSGFYAVYGQVGSNAFRILGTSHPIAVVAGGPCYDQLPGCSFAPGTLYFRVSEGVSRFGVVVAGGGGSEKVSARIYNPLGEEVASFDNVGWCKAWYAEGPVLPGLWSVKTSRPTEGCLDDNQIDLLGLTPVFFLCREKTWISR